MCRGYVKRYGKNKVVYLKQRKIYIDIYEGKIEEHVLFYAGYDNTCITTSTKEIYFHVQEFEGNVYCVLLKKCDNGLKNIFDIKKKSKTWSLCVLFFLLKTLFAQTRGSLLLCMSMWAGLL